MVQAAKFAQCVFRSEIFVFREHVCHHDAPRRRAESARGVRSGRTCPRRTRTPLLTEQWHGNTMTIRVTSSSATSVSLSGYCAGLGFRFCKGQDCGGIGEPLCGPCTFSRVTVSYVQGCQSASDCNDGNPCTTDTCVADQCGHANNSNTCNDGVFCNGPDTCGGGTCSVHQGNPCEGPDGDGNCAESCRSFTVSE